MTSGLDWNEEVAYDDPANPSDLMEATDDWVQFVIDRPMATEPGTVFAYSSGVTELFAHIFKKETGPTSRSTRDVICSRRSASSTTTGNARPSASSTPRGLYLRTEDLTKLGQLFLQEGRWKGARIVSSDGSRSRSRRGSQPARAFSTVISGGSCRMESPAKRPGWHAASVGSGSSFFPRAADRDLHRLATSDDASIGSIGQTAAAGRSPAAMCAARS